MKIFGKTFIFVGMILIFAFSGRVVAQEEAVVSVDYSSEAVKAFIDLQNAIRNGEDGKAWEMLARFHQRLRYDGDIENFKKEFSEPKRREEFSNLKIEGIRPLTADEAELVISSSLSPLRFYIVQEDGKWKFGGRIGPPSPGGPRRKE